MAVNTRSRNKLKRILTFPIRMLGKARDLYVDAMNSYADTGYYASAGFGTSVSNPLPRSFSATSSRSTDVDYRELIRAASARSYADKLDLDAPNPVHQKAAVPSTKAVKRSASVGMAKIEEDKPCEIVDDEIAEKKRRKGSGLFSRSRSYAVSSTATTTTTNRFNR